LVGLIKNSGLAIFLDLNFNELHQNYIENANFRETIKSLRIEEQRLITKAKQDLKMIKIKTMEDVNSFDLKNWELNIFDKSPIFLCSLSKRLFEDMGFIKKYGIHDSFYDKFISELYTWYTYRQNPYHNFKHAINGKIRQINL